MKLTFQTGAPTHSGTYLVVCLLDGDRIVTQAEYSVPRNEWTVEQYQAYDPHWEEFVVQVSEWAEFPWQEFS